ncbi:malonyl-CoA decarboxylase [Amphritea sp. HPY]|uniref:malonyl-CoA decarboxylase n=1 Tax=Amphritea sp. HPY TaxID=3421652 RepID=UPI003D7CF5E9
MHFNKLLNSVADAGRDLLFKEGRARPQKTLENYCSDLLSNKGEALGTAIASEVVKAYQESNEEKKLAFFYHLLEKYSPDSDIIIQLAQEYKSNCNADTLIALNEAVESPRQTLFRRINLAPKGAKTIVGLRSDLLSILKKHPDLKPIDYDLQHLLKSWFNRGFLVLEEIDWNTSAAILEKLIRYEAVHSMSGWEDLKKRLSRNRRCFTFVHPSLPGEPLIFVEVALTFGLANAVQPLIDPGPEESLKESRSDTAIFYSISNCQKGLTGISFGNFLIKQVVMELKKELPALTQFATLSPIPGFRRWLSSELENREGSFIRSTDREALELLKREDWQQNKKNSEVLKPILMRLCANYLNSVKRGKNPFDPVTKFHLGNGARIERINWMGDTSANGMALSAGILVNYSYDIPQVEKNHEAFVNEGAIITSKEFNKQLLG